MSHAGISDTRRAGGFASSALYLRCPRWVPPVGFEPTHTAPEAVALSPELWGLSVPRTLSPAPERGEPSGAEWTQQHYQCAASSGQMTDPRRRAATEHAFTKRGHANRHAGRGTKPRWAKGLRLHRSATKAHCTGAPTDTRRERPAGARGEHTGHGHPGRYGDRLCHWYAAGTRETRARPEPDKRPNFARCVARSG